MSRMLTCHSLVKLPPQTRHDRGLFFFLQHTLQTRWGGEMCPNVREFRSASKVEAKSWDKKTRSTFFLRHHHRSTSGTTLVCRYAEVRGILKSKIADCWYLLILQNTVNIPLNHVPMYCNYMQSKPLLPLTLTHTHTHTCVCVCREETSGVLHTTDRTTAKEEEGRPPSPFSFSSKTLNIWGKGTKKFDFFFSIHTFLGEEGGIKAGSGLKKWWAWGRLFWHGDGGGGGRGEKQVHAKNCGSNGRSLLALFNTHVEMHRRSNNHLWSR